jgi:predicted transcriptional regulator
MQQFVRNYFDNSFKSMVSFFANNQDITLEELDDIRRMIDAVPQDDSPAKTE